MKLGKALFPLNVWYAAAYDVELARQLLPRTIRKQKRLLFRKTDGTVAALEDACRRRMPPLSMGRPDVGMQADRQNGGAGNIAGADDPDLAGGMRIHVIAGLTRHPCRAGQTAWMPGQARHDSL